MWPFVMVGDDVPGFHFVESIGQHQAGLGAEVKQYGENSFLFDTAHFSRIGLPKVFAEIIFTDGEPSDSLHC